MFKVAYNCYAWITQQDNRFLSNRVTMTKPTCDIYVVSARYTMPYSYQVETSLLFFVIDLDHDPSSSNFELDLYHMMSHTCTKLFKSVKPFIRCRP